MSNTILDHYRALEIATQRMLDSARLARWADVSDIRRDCARLIAELKQAATQYVMSADEQIERLRVMRRIVLMEGEVRRLSSPTTQWLDRMFMRQVPAV